jgi:hypothetical protein
MSFRKFPVVGVSFRSKATNYNNFIQTVTITDNRIHDLVIGRISRLILTSAATLAISKCAFCMILSLNSDNFLKQR